MGVLYLWITTSLVSGTMPVQETKQRIQRQQELQCLRALGVGLSTRCKMVCGPRRVHFNSQKYIELETERVTRARVAHLL